MAEREPPTQQVHHVEPRGNQWALRKEGAKQATGYFETKEEAEDRARQIAEKHGSSVVIHDRHGNVKKRWDRL